MKAGDLVVYIKGKAAEIGKIKLITPGGLWAAVWFHTGETAAMTRLNELKPLINSYVITETNLGGELGKGTGK